MAELASIVSNERLIDINYEKDKLKGLFTEILKILQTQQSKIAKIEEKLPDYTEISEFEDLMKSNSSDHETFSLQIKAHDAKIKQNNESLIEKEESLKKYIDDSILSCMNETKRMMAAEFSAFRTTPQLSKSNSLAVIQPQPVPDTTEFRMNDLEAALNELKAETADIKQKMDIKVEFDPSVVDLKVGTLENDIKLIQKQLETYPTMQVDINNISMTIPSQISKIDQKLAKLSEQVGRALNNQEILAMASKVVTEANEFKAQTPAPTPTKEDQPPPIASLPVPNNAVKLAELKTNEIAELPDLDKIKMPTAVQIQLPSDLPSSTYLTDSNKSTGRTKVETIVSNVTTPGLSRSNSTVQDAKDGVVQIIENRTYTTELTSSMRVVTEIEWLKQMIGTHHEAIKTMQTSLRTQHENLETMNENVVRVNTTINSRISQLAQQSLNQRQEMEELRKLVFDQLTKVKKDISAVQTSRNDMLLANNIPLAATSTNGSAKSTSRSFRKLELLPPLPVPTYEMPKSNEISPKKDPSPPPLPPQIPVIQEVPHEQPKPKVEILHKKPRKQNFLIVDIYDDTPPPPPTQQFKPPEPTKTVPKDDYNSMLKTRPRVEEVKNSSRSTHSNQPPPEEPQQATKIIQQEEYIPPEPEKKETTITKTIILKLGNYKRPRSAGMDKTRYEQGKEDTFADADLENRVKNIARRVVEAMVNHVKDQLSEQIKIVQQNSANLTILLDKKVDREFVETMYNKFRVMMNTFNDQIENMQASFLNWVTRDELEIVLQKFAQMIQDDGAAAAAANYNFLICNPATQKVTAAGAPTGYSAQTATAKKRATTTK